MSDSGSKSVTSSYRSFEGMKGELPLSHSAKSFTYHTQLGDSSESRIVCEICFMALRDQKFDISAALSKQFLQKDPGNLTFLEIYIKSLLNLGCAEEVCEVVLMHAAAMDLTPGLQISYFDYLIITQKYHECFLWVWQCMRKSFNHEVCAYFKSNLARNQSEKPDFAASLRDLDVDIDVEPFDRIVIAFSDVHFSPEEVQTINKSLTDEISPLPHTLPSLEGAFERFLCEDATSRNFIGEARTFHLSTKMQNLIAKAAAFEPEIGTVDGNEISLCPPWHDAEYVQYRKVTSLIPEGNYDNVILMPSGRLGGADLVAAILARTLTRRGSTLILRTDDTHWERPDWYSRDVHSVDLSSAFKSVQNPTHALYVLLSEVRASRVYNVNSRLAFETFSRYGARLALQFRLYAYYFCSDRTETGLETGYPVWFFANVLPHLTAAITDSKDLALTLMKRFAIPTDVPTSVRTIYTPAQTPVAKPSMATLRSLNPELNHTRILWAGRFDRQKCFELAIEIARAMPDTVFDFWGKSVLDAPPSLHNIPKNVTIHQPFSSYDELPLSEADGWLYTSAWDGLPTILIELGALGMPIVASIVGGVGELIDDTTGWPVPSDGTVADYVIALRNLLSDKEARLRRAHTLQERVRIRHSLTEYEAEINSI